MKTSISRPLWSEWVRQCGKGIFQVVNGMGKNQSWILNHSKESEFGSPQGCGGSEGPEVSTPSTSTVTVPILTFISFT